MIEISSSGDNGFHISNIQKIVLETLYDAHKKGISEVDLGIIEEKVKSELSYFADAISLLRESSLIWTPREGTFGITNNGMREYKLRNSIDNASTSYLA